MYKVFINDRPIIFTSLQEVENKSANHCFAVNPNAIIFKELRQKINSEKKITPLYLACENVQESFELFKKDYKIIEAAGGIVESEEGNFLWIYRLQKWDLPKGKMEKGEERAEAALREVEEECGLDKLKLNEYIGATYHTYELKGKLILKPTYWFSMSVLGQPDLTPQLEEDITACTWLNKEEIAEKALSNTYQSIKEIYKQLLTAWDKSH